MQPPNSKKRRGEMRGKIEHFFSPLSKRRWSKNINCESGDKGVTRDGRARVVMWPESAALRLSTVCMLATVLLRPLFTLFHLLFAAYRHGSDVALRSASARVSREVARGLSICPKWKCTNSLFVFVPRSGGRVGFLRLRYLSRSRVVIECDAMHAGCKFHKQHQQKKKNKKRGYGETEAGSRRRAVNFCVLAADYCAISPYMPL
ncbi:hypothetical protein DFJ77DRAFT_256300 [Powellomyces hirtus]|nr:hypothetical protein DFJ77DRAFT_256300 [Powellomyces hirtus]